MGPTCFPLYFAGAARCSHGSQHRPCQTSSWGKGWSLPATAADPAAHSLRSMKTCCVMPVLALGQAAYLRCLGHSEQAIATMLLLYGYSGSFDNDFYQFYCIISTFKLEKKCFLGNTRKFLWPSHSDWLNGSWGYHGLCTCLCKLQMKWIKNSNPGDKFWNWKIASCYNYAFCCKIRIYGAHTFFLRAHWRL